MGPGKGGNGAGQMCIWLNVTILPATHVPTFHKGTVNPRAGGTLDPRDRRWPGHSWVVPWRVSGSPALYQARGLYWGQEEGLQTLGLLLRDKSSMSSAVGKETWPSGPLASTGMAVGSARL